MRKRRTKIFYKTEIIKGERGRKKKERKFTPLNYYAYTLKILNEKIYIYVYI